VGDYTLRELISAFECHFKSEVIITSGNHIPGSRSYSDLMDTWADRFCLYPPARSQAKATLRNHNHGNSPPENNIVSCNWLL